MHPGARLSDRPLNEHHVREYTQEEFAALLQEHFSVCEWFGQTMFSVSYCRLLESVGRSTSVVATRVHQARKLATSMWKGYASHYPQPLTTERNAEVLIAVCSAP